MVARPWTSRLKYAGTYDDAWLHATREDVAAGRPADYARDFDPRFFQCAHPGLILPDYLEGDEEIVLTGLMPGAASGSSSRAASGSSSRAASGSSSRAAPFAIQLPGVRAVAELRNGKEPCRGARISGHDDKLAILSTGR